MSTLSTDGVANLAPFSFFTAVGRKPPMVSISMQHRSDGVTLKDSFVNIRDTGEFVTNLVTLPLADAMHKSAFEHAPEVDEFAVTGLEKAPSTVVRPPRVANAPVAFECKLERLFTVGDHDDHVVWGRIVAFHIRDDLYLPGGRIDTAAIRRWDASRPSTRSWTRCSPRPWTRRSSPRATVAGCGGWTAIRRFLADRRQGVVAVGQRPFGIDAPKPRPCNAEES